MKRVGALGEPAVATSSRGRNRTHHILRRRFSFAHEYAHVLLDRELKAILSHARDRSSLMEVRANAFAASFLMPAEGVRGYVNALSKGLGSRTRADTFDEEAVTRVEGRKRVDTQNIELHDVCQDGPPFRRQLHRHALPLEGLDFVTEDERSSLAAQDSAGLAKALRGFLVFRSRSIPTARCGSMPGSWRWRSRPLTRGKITQRKLDELGSLVQVSDLSRRLRRAGLGWIVALSTKRSNEHSAFLRSRPSNGRMWYEEWAHSLKRSAWVPVRTKCNSSPLT